MLHYKSKPDDIIHYINQMKMLLLSKQEKEHITKILSLENIIKDTETRDLIIKDLENEHWVDETQVLINICQKKLKKTMLVEKHIGECYNFIVYRFLEEKAFLVDIEIYKQISGWNFNEIDKYGEKNKWVSQKFMRAFDASELHNIFDNFLREKNILKIDLKWLHMNRTIFFSENIFNPLKVN